MTKKFSIPSIFTVSYKKKQPKEEVRKEVEIVDLAHSARKQQRVYCLAHTNKLVMKHYPEMHMWRCETCAYTIHEGYGQSLMKKRKEDTRYHIINDPYAPQNRHKDTQGNMPVGFAIGRQNDKGLEQLSEPINKDSIRYHSAKDAAKDTEEPWYPYYD